MKLAALILEKSDIENKVSQLVTRINSCARIQEGDTAPEEPAELLEELNTVYKRLELVNNAITRANHSAKFSDNQPYLINALVARDVLAKKIGQLNSIVNSCGTQQRFARNEIKFVTNIDVVSLRAEIDKLTKEKRDLNAKIQELNWIVDVTL